jgi:hypothetical protein
VKAVVVEETRQLPLSPERTPSSSPLPSLSPPPDPVMGAVEKTDTGNPVFVGEEEDAVQTRFCVFLCVSASVLVIFFSVWINCCSGYFNGVLYSYF